MASEYRSYLGRLISFLNPKTLTQRILYGMLLGIAVGLFFGEDAAVLQPVSNLYLRLSQMAVMPYMMLTLINGVGRLSAVGASKLGRMGGLLLGFFWLVTLSLLAVAPFILPEMQSASFFSNDWLQAPQVLDLLKIFVPSNPFDAMSKAVIPGVVLFSLAVGVALIGVENKTIVLDAVRVLEQAMLRVMMFIVKFTPVGVFAIGAITAGTMSLDTLQRLQVYFITYVLLSCLLTFVVLPITVTAVMPLRYREVMVIAKDALFTSFISANVFIAYPLIIEKVKESVRSQHAEVAAAFRTIDVLAPMVFTFPNPGKLLVLLFVPYAAWLVGEYFTFSTYVGMLVMGLFSLFASTQAALPALFDMIGVSQGYLSLYLSTTIVTNNFGSLVASMYLLVFLLLGEGATLGIMRFNLLRIVRHLTIAVVLCGGSLYGAKLLFDALIDKTYTKDQILLSMKSRGSLPANVLTELPMPDDLSGNPLDRIKQRGVLRVGFVQERLPFSFMNAKKDLVGMDVELAGNLALALDAKALEFVQVPSGQLVEALAKGHVDVLMSLPYETDSLRVLNHSASYFDTVIGVAVKDRNRSLFMTVDEIYKRGSLTLGRSADDHGLEQLIKAGLTSLDLKFVELASVRDYFDGKRTDIDGVLMLASSAASWTLLYPEYSVVVPQPNLVRLPVGIATRRDDRSLALFIDQWLVIQRSNGTLTRAYDYWVLGKDIEQKQKRWSIKQDVLGW